MGSNCSYSKYFKCFFAWFFFSYVVWGSFFLLILGSRREREKEREKQTDTDLLFHLFMHSLVVSCMCPDGHQTRNLGVEVVALTN